MNKSINGFAIVPDRERLKVLLIVTDDQVALDRIAKGEVGENVLGLSIAAGNLGRAIAADSIHVWLVKPDKTSYEATRIRPAVEQDEEVLTVLHYLFER